MKPIFFSMMIMFKPFSLDETLMVIHKLPYKHISHILCNWFLSYNIYNAQIQIPSLHSRVNSVTQEMVQTNGRDGSRDRSREPDLGIGTPLRGERAGALTGASGEGEEGGGVAPFCPACPPPP